jgi:nitroreductase
MDLFETFHNRRSVRKYQDRPVPEDLLTKVLEAARCAPSWANTQCWRFVVVKDAATRRKLAEALPTSNPSRRALETAPVVIAACGKKGISGFYKNQASTVNGDWLMFDVALAASQLTLAAHALGLGTVHVGLLDLNAAAEVLGVPADHQLVELIPLGYPDQVPNAPARKPLSDIVYWERWQKTEI